VLGADAVVAEPAGLLLGVQDRALGTLGDAHRPTSSVVCGLRATRVWSAEWLRRLQMVRG
jgi:hypothetical protein